MLQLNSLLALLKQSAAYQRVLGQVAHNKPLPDQHLLRAARPFVAAALANDLQRPLLLVAATVERAYNIAEQLPVWLPNRPILRFAEPNALFYERSPWASNSIRARLETLAALAPPLFASEADTPPPIVVCSALALMSKTLPPREFRANSRLLKVGGQTSQEALMRFWLSIGYESASIVTEPGTFTRRGGIIDIYPAQAMQPVRIEFFGDEIESIRPFDPATQRSVGQLASISITPAREALPKFAGQALPNLANWLASCPSADQDAASPQPDADDLAQAVAFPNIEFYLPYFHSTPASLIDYLPSNALVLVEDWAALQEGITDLEVQAVGLRQERLALGYLPANPPQPYFGWEECREALRRRNPLHLAGGLGDADADAPTLQELDADEEAMLGPLFAPLNRYGGQLRLFLEALRRLRHDLPVVLSNQSQRLAELWREGGGGLLPVLSALEAAPEGVTFVEGSLAEGFFFKTAGLHLFTDSEIFGWKRPEPRRRQLPRAVSPESYFADLRVGDYVVHLEYGVARFAGLQKRSLDGNLREYLSLQFSGTDMLYVPIHQADRLSRYVGADDHEPQLSRLGSSEWATAKAAAKRAAEEVARELLDLYARRSTLKGHIFSPDGLWQHELEASFPFIETDDQLRALAEVKADMERAMPMDRLLCGDVGYGKTEIALRAAFKAVTDSKQVALLVPTTVLAQQHFNTFSQRLAAYPLRVELLSRFRSPREQRAVIAKTLSGEVDILIGTHRLLQNDVVFRDLGLLIIDEEQRFGVTHKERLKRMRAEVDVLTMTATPIPRTLYMGLAGIRDISMIQTPPAERLPVLTHVGAYDEKLIRQAILREVDRGGQIFFVHNRVHSIDAMADHLRRIVPEAKIIIGHGQMEEDELERVMSQFADGQADILLSTTIIESGLDIANANTIIIDNADKFGLAQLYQLRGRVGRSSNRAYAYLFYPRSGHLNPDARARLETIAEQTELGAGYNIAMRDLEIRGTGELLGAKQSGFIAAVGFQLYTQLLAQAVRQLRAEPETRNQPKPRFEVPPSIGNLVNGITLDLPVPAYVPVDFMPDAQMRLQLYRRLAELDTLPAVDQIESELQDRFGGLPPEVAGLMFSLRVKILAYEANVNAILSTEEQISIKLPYLATVDRAGLQRYLGQDTRVSRVAVWLARAEPNWQPRLLEILAMLSQKNVAVVP
jgi:transcription-repair coupling factor (superfamily II helicase)